MRGKPLQQLIKDVVTQGIVEAIGCAVTIQDTKFKILYQNEQAKSISGDHTGKFCYRAIENRNDICEGCPLVLSLRDGKVHTAERWNAANRDLIVELTTSALKDSSGHIIAGIKVVRDVTERRRLEEQRELLVSELKESLGGVRTLKGFLPVCASCHKIRDDNNNWTNLDVYIRDHSEAEITHGYCPECAIKHFSTDNKNVYDSSDR